MRKQLLIFIAFLSISNLYAQDIFMQAGKNITSYDFVTNQSVSPTPPDYRVGTGNFYEIGYSPRGSMKKGPIQNLTYLVSLTYNEFNAEASKDLNSYAWKTSYVGLQNVIEYSFYETRTGVKLSLNAGLNAATIIKGDQFINNVFYDLTTNEEFSGLVMQGIVGLNTKYTISKDVTCNLGCNYSKAYNNTINSDFTQLTINTLQFKFGLHYLLKQKRSRSGFNSK
jgi:hypothetical protein